MPSTIPYNPNLVLGNIVTSDALDLVEQISTAQAPIDAAQDYLNSLISSRRSFDSTKTELAELDIDTTPIDDALKSLNADIVKAAVDYATKKVAGEATVRDAKSKLRGVNSNYETPLDYVTSSIKSLPLAADSLNMDVQYFSLDAHGQSATSFASAVGHFVSASVGYFGDSYSSQASTAAQKQVSQQVENHKITGTLVISVSCTHKNASVFAPLIINVDKGIKAWNHLFPKDYFNPEDQASIAKLAAQPEPDKGKKYSIISGMTFGSSFVGMVHVLNTTDSSVSETMNSLTSNIKAQMDAGSWFSSLSGNFGVDASFANDVKNLLSAQNVTSHVTLISMGVIPSIVANDVALSVKTLTDFDPAKNMTALATLQNATAGTVNSINDAANGARTGQQMASLKSESVKSALSALGDLDDKSNKILDINSMMTALQDFLSKASDGTAGVPINYYLKDVTKIMLAEMYVAKYCPGMYTAISNDDSAPAPKTNGANGTSSAANGGSTS